MGMLAAVQRPQWRGLWWVLTSIALGSAASALAEVASSEVQSIEQGPKLLRLSSEQLAHTPLDHLNAERLTESSEAGDVSARDLVWHESDDRCLQTGVYETGANRYTIDEPYPHDELMMFISGGVTLTPTVGAPVVVHAGDTVLLPKGWTGLWHSDGYRKFYVIYGCPTDS